MGDNRIIKADWNHDKNFATHNITLITPYWFHVMFSRSSCQTLNQQNHRIPYFQFLLHNILFFINNLLQKIINNFVVIQ